MKINNLLLSLGFETSNLTHFITAFTHPSFGNENNCESYDRLEFLGDALIDFLVAEKLFLKTSEEEGMMTRIRSNFVCEESLAFFARKLLFHDYILLGKGAKKNAEEKHDGILSNVFEAFCAAIYLTFDLSKLRLFLEEHFFSHIDFSHFIGEFKDYKSQLQEYIRSSSQKEINYFEVNRTGPAHDLVFEVIVKHDDIILGRGSGKTKKEAEQMAAKDALSKKVI